ncbi:MAG: hypothetical protein ACP5HP_03680 [Thermogladius sp.]
MRAMKFGKEFDDRGLPPRHYTIYERYLMIEMEYSEVELETGSRRVTVMGALVSLDEVRGGKKISSLVHFSPKTYNNKPIIDVWHKGVS